MHRRKHTTEFIPKSKLRGKQVPRGFKTFKLFKPFKTF